MAYLTLHIDCTEEQADLLSSVLLDLDFSGTSFEEGKLTAYATDLETDLSPLHKLLTALQLRIAKKEITEDQNWNELWESNFHDLKLDDLHIRAPFHPPLELNYEIVIHPKMAFGTGHHATTQLMLKAMRTVDFKGKSVLDMGCGSGILSIHANQLGAGEVLGIDYDPNSISNSLENIQLNRTENVSIQQADNLDEVTRRFDIILSNIVKNINFSLVPSFAAKLSNNGHLILCGLLQKDLNEAAALAQALNLDIIEQNTQGEWLQLTLLKRL